MKHKINFSFKSLTILLVLMLGVGNVWG